MGNKQVTYTQGNHLRVMQPAEIDEFIHVKSDKSSDIDAAV